MHHIFCNHRIKSSSCIHLHSVLFRCAFCCMMLVLVASVGLIIAISCYCINNLQYLRHMAYFVTLPIYLILLLLSLPPLQLFHCSHFLICISNMCFRLVFSNKNFTEQTFQFTATQLSIVLRTTHK